MDNTPTYTLLKHALSKFNVSTGNSIDVREGVALVDFHLRIAYTLSILYSRRHLTVPMQLLPTPGFGSMLSVIRQAAKIQISSDTPWFGALTQAWCNEIAKFIDKFKVPNKYRNFKSLRDRLSHGSPLPIDEATLKALAASLSTLIEELNSSIANHLGTTTVSIQDERVRLQQGIHLPLLDLSPLWTIQSAGPAVGIFSHFADDGIYFMGSDGELWSDTRPEAILRFRRLFFSEKFGPGTELSKLVREVLADITAYTEDYSRPSYFFGDDEASGYLYVTWTRSTSDGNEPRIDAFRIGPDSRREWEIQSGYWTSYSDFLKRVSNWELLARRIGIGLDSFYEKKEAEESSRLGTTTESEIRGPSKLIEMEEDHTGLSPHVERKAFELSTRVDDACRRMKPSTSVFFLVGQAGLGKTELMLSLARERARSLTSSMASDLPLYLFVTSTGRSLSSLEDAVDSALNITKLLSSHSAKALCRNGLLVLMVDGFDELLGSSGYENALGSLEPWFRELGGRGVLVASARSSYYLTQYRRSLAAASGLNVDHTLIELQPWTNIESRDYLVKRGVSLETMQDVKPRDWEILSIPFFAKAFAAWYERTIHMPRSVPSILELVVDQFLSREAGKLRDPNAGELLSTEELRELFSEVAEIMQESKNREIEQSDLVYCAQIVIGTQSLENARPGLTRRLSSLCGLGVRSDSTGQNQFGFSHEVLFDCFLTLAIQRRLSGVFNELAFRALLSASSINSAVFEWLLEKDNRLIAKLENDELFTITKGVESRVASANFGSLWEALLKQRTGVPPTQMARGVSMNEIYLSADEWKSVDFSGSTISHLSIQEGAIGEIHLANAEVSYLEISSSSQALKCLKGIDTANIESLKIGSYFTDHPNQVAEKLQEIGLVVKSSNYQQSEEHLAADYYLKRLIRRPDVPIILDREDKTAKDQRLKWIDHHNVDLWVRFIDALLISEAARLEPLPASGRPKVRLSFITPASDLLKRVPENDHVGKFWDSL